MRRIFALLLLALAVPTAGAETIKGFVKVADAMAKKVTPQAVLFVIARPQGVKAGPPLAVVRIASPKFPQAFELGPNNVMAGGEFKGAMTLTAKLSKTGDPMTASGDLLGETANKQPVVPGAKEVQVVLDKAAP
ncbi:MAG: hypothetical protein KF799_08900 [Bdellovibrionales bacterium]|nr:hypothetical protein [Bdellovibrionales bacterium]